MVQGVERVKSFKRIVRVAIFGCALAVFANAIAEEQNNEMISTSSKKLVRPEFVRAKVGIDATHFGLDLESRLLSLIGSEVILDFPTGAMAGAPPWSFTAQFFLPQESSKQFYFSPQLSFLWQSSRLLIPVGVRFLLPIDPLLCRIESAVLFRADQLSARSLFLVEYPVSGDLESGSFLGFQIDHSYTEAQKVTVGGQITAGTHF
jgi:hypothetical protein